MDESVEPLRIVLDVGDDAASSGHGTNVHVRNLPEGAVVMDVALGEMGWRSKGILVREVLMDVSDWLHSKFGEKVYSCSTCAE